MGLESATYISQLVSTNPLASDTKSQGDDHLRLIKAVLQNSLPNADRPFRFPEVVIKNNTYNVVEADDGKYIILDTSITSFIVNLPTPSYDGWQVSLIKGTVDQSFVRVTLTSGSVNGLAGMRIGAPYVEHKFVWLGGSFYRVKAPGENPPGTIVWHAGPSIPIGWGLANGQSLVTIDHPELFEVWSTTYGSAGAGFFNAPDLRDRFPVGAGATYGVGSTGGVNTVTLGISEMPSHSHVLNESPHDHGISSEGVTGTATGGANSVVGANPIPVGNNVATDISPAVTGITMNAAGGGAAHENRPPYFGLLPIFMLR